VSAFGHTSAHPAAPLSLLPSVLQLKDVVKKGMRERFDTMRWMGIRAVMIGDNPLIAPVIAGEVGVDDVLAEAAPQDKLAVIKREQEVGKLVAMTGDGTNPLAGGVRHTPTTRHAVDRAAKKVTGNDLPRPRTPTR
jgi:K+-transporting ATPase ATPase B chain